MKAEEYCEIVNLENIGAIVTSARGTNRSLDETTWYYERVVLPKRSYMKVEWLTAIINSPVHREVQADGRIRFWGRVPEFGNRYFRVVTLEDGKTILNAFPDRRFREPTT